MAKSKKALPPTHPGGVLREFFIKKYMLTVTEVARGLGVARVNLSAIVNERAGISTELSIKLSEAFGNTPQFWINLQTTYDLFYAEKKVNRKKVKRFVRSK